MNDKKNLYFVVVILLLAITGAVSWRLYFKDYRQRDTVDIHRFPVKIGEWTAVDLPLTEEEYAILETRNVVARKYTHTDGRGVYLLLVYSQYNRKVSHPPEVCYTGSGISVVESRATTIPLEGGKIFLGVNRLLLELRGEQQCAYYWFKVGDSYTPNYWKQQFLIANNLLKGRSHSSALIRVSADIVSGNKEVSLAIIRDFIGLIHPLLQEYLP